MPLRFEALESRNLFAANLVADIAPGDADAGIEDIVAFDNKVLFEVTEVRNNNGIWISDGTEEGTTLLREFGVGEDGVYVAPHHRMVKFGDHVYFLGNSNLVRTDGTSDGFETFMEFGFQNFVTNAVQVGDQLFLVTRTQFWVTDGTKDGTDLLLDDIQPRWGRDGDQGHLRAMPERGLVAFLAQSPSDPTQDQLWFSDGTVNGTYDLFAEIEPPAEPGIMEIMPHHDKLYITQGRELWVTDGTGAGTEFVSEIPEPVSSPVSFAATESHLFFAAGYGTTRALWKTDGTADGTIRFIRVSSSRPQVVLNDEVYVVGTPLLPRGPQGLWATNGTNLREVLGTARVGDLFVTDGLLIFSLYNRAHGRELWQSDGTTSGTFRVSDIRPGKESSDPDQLAAANGTIFFIADDGIHGRELWRYDVSIIGDADGDDEVGFSDFAILSSHFGQETDQGFEAGDFNNDGEVDFSDFLLLSKNFGLAASPPAVSVAATDIAFASDEDSETEDDDLDELLLPL